jgi:Flp pilus assembly protein TadG
MTLASERGDATLELALVTPVMMLLLLGLLQFSLWCHARNVVQTAALEAARSAAVGDDGEARARQVLRSGLGRTLLDPAVEVQFGRQSVRVVVDGTMRGLLPIPGLTSVALKGSSLSFREDLAREESTP